MGLFSLTKKPEEKRPVQKFAATPSFPQFPEPEQDEMPEFPSYEPSIGDIKKEITKPVDFEVPMREKKVEKNMFASQEPEAMEEMHSTANLASQPQSHTLFVKIEKFKEAMHDMHNLKTKLNEAEKILSSLEELKAEEDTKLARWSSELQAIKEKLMSVDKNLFEK